MFFKKREIDKNNKKRPLLVISFLIFLFLFTFLFSTAKPAYAQFSDPVAATQRTVKFVWDKVSSALATIWRKAGSQALQQAILSATKKIAFDTATWVGSGGKGQKPQFVTEGWGDYLTNIGDQAAGQYIEQLGRDNGFEDFNLCEPDFAVKMNIGLGLVQQQRPSAPNCTLKEMYKNWDKELNSPDFLSKFQATFDPAQSDLGAALTLQTGIMEDKEAKKDIAWSELLTKLGWKEKTDIAGNTTATPEEAKNELEAATELYRNNFGKFTGDAMTDTLKVFVNQLAITAFNTAMRNLGKGSGPASSPYDYGGLFDYNASPGVSGVSGAGDSLRKLLEPSFDTRADYDILGSLSSCTKMGGYAPTNGCIIEEGFRQAIEERKTVGEAMTLGYLKKDWSFGFKTMGVSAIEPEYNQGYPYRSMLVLRKYRIIPVGWELAAEYLHSNQEKLKDATLVNMVACFDPNDSYAGYNEVWCRGLVDPNWVLKAPQNFCAKEGYGPEIVSDEIVDDGNGGTQRMVARNDAYCADEQSCIKEKNDGSCEAYGYCTEERRSWKFEADVCDPKYNTCQTFRGKNGQTFSYLENTLNYAGCNIDNVGCKEYAKYSSGFSYDAVDNVVAWGGTNSIYFDADAGECSQENEGCHEFIRTKSGLGTNLIINSGFEDSQAGEEIFTTTGANKFSNWPLWLFDDDGSQTMTAGIVNDSGSGGKVFHIKVNNGKGGLYSLDSSSAVNSAMPENFVMEPGVAYTLSAWVKLMSGDSMGMGIGNNNTEFKTAIFKKEEFGSDFKKIVLTVNNDNILAANEFYIYGYGTGVEFYIDNIQLEIGSQATTYKEYGAANKVYEKLAPSYLNCGVANPPAKCDRFIETCQRADVGCELYTSVSDGVSIPAKTTTSDYCPAECAEFDSYIQLKTNFADSASQYFIPKTADTCSADAVGCDEFTNLDEVAKGGEGKEYYSYLRGCIKPDASCAEFYTWEGSDESGYQLKVFNFQSISNVNPEPKTFNDTNCSEVIYNLPATDPGYNSDCRQFYNRAGGISYHSYTKTISCSDNCFSYRRTATDESQANCEKYNGVWNDPQKACIYMAIPGEGKSCSAAQAGCREYSGNKGSNMRIVLNNDFEGSKQDWTGGDTNGEALTVGGNSFGTTGSSASRIVGASVGKDRSYVLSFVAKKNTATEFSSIGFVKGSDTKEFTVSSSSKKLESEWKLYKFNLASLEHEVGADEALIIMANGSFYIDDIRLTEVVDRYYLIKDSWQTPPSCNQDINKNPSPLYMLGCSQYQDRDNKTSYLHNFSQLCQESVVGCELMIDTHNSIATSSLTVKGITVPADKFIYAVYDKNKGCNSADKGCERFGSPYKYGIEVVYSDVYIKNDPDKYKEILCEVSASGCVARSSENSTSYFKDPGDMVCEWRQPAGKGDIGWGWYEKKVKKCNGTGKVCLSDGNCASGETCQPDTGVDIFCPASNLKTFGYGGQGKSIYQPTKDLTGNWAGACPAAEASCTEFIDPISKPSSALSYIANDEITLEPNTLYILKAGSAEMNPCTAIYRLLTTNNSLSGKETSISAVAGDDVVFFSGSDENNKCKASGSGEIRKAMIEYRLKDGLAKNTCNSTVDFEKGCILFNERTQNGSNGLASLSYPASMTDYSVHILPVSIPGKNNANQLLKVIPDRICDKWLACRSYIKEEGKNNVCFDVGLCNSLDDTGNCDNFVASSQTEQVFKTGDDPGAISNLSGYSKFGYAGGKLGNNYYPLGGMKQIGEVVGLSNGGFEMAGGNGYPVGWTNTSNGIWNDSMFKVITDANEAEKALGGGSPPEGKNILKMSSGTSIASEEINFEKGTYIISAYINTMALSGGDVGIRLIDLSKNIKEDLFVPSGNSRYFIKEFTLAVPLQGKLSVYSEATGGAAYLDDIKIKPALEIKQNTYSSQSCRLYPKQDSLSCDYFDSAGTPQKGLTGYCLEHDRLPGSPDACLIWYPIDKVKGEGVEESAGYNGKFPLYYCTERQGRARADIKAMADDNISLMFAKDGMWYYDGVNGITDTGLKTDLIDSDSSINLIANMDPGKYVILATVSDRNTYKTDKQRWYFNVNMRVGGVKITTAPNSNWKCIYSGQSDGKNYYPPWFNIWTDAGKLKPSGILQYDYDYRGVENSSGVKYEWRDVDIVSSTQNPDVYNVWIDEAPQRSALVCRATFEIPNVCTKFVQTVSAAGDNKVFQSRLSGGENSFTTKVNNILGPSYPQTANYSSDAPPFGTIVYPKPATNPYEWDTSEEDGIQPLYYSDNKKISRMGQLYTTTDLKNIFAQSYGGYKLSYGKCGGSATTNYGDDCLYKQTCVGGSCAENSTTNYFCDDKSKNSGEECSTTACEPKNCIYNEYQNKYRCGGGADSPLCCASLSLCDLSKCSNGANCEAPSGNIIPDCKSTSKYKCNATTNDTDPNSGVDCCFEGSCLNTCDSGVNAGKPCSNSDSNCPIMKCSNNNSVCSGTTDPACLKAKTCVDGDNNNGDCSGGSAACNGTDGVCLGRKCNGGEHNTADCSADSAACNGTDGVCLGRKCNGGDNNQTDCSTNSAICNGVNGTCSERRCDGGDNDGKVCTNNSYCSAGGGTCPSGTCSGGTKVGACYSSSDCLGTSGTCLSGTCSGGKYPGSSCYDSSGCPSNDGVCLAGTCSRGTNLGACYGSSDCPSHDGTCIATYYDCAVSTTFGRCNMPRCSGGSGNNGISCTLGGNNKGCTNSADICIEVYRDSKNSNKRCCGIGYGNPECKGSSTSKYTCTGGTTPAGTPCLSVEKGFCNNGVCSEKDGRYVPDSGFTNWNSPTVICPGTPPTRGNTFCAIPPEIKSIQANNGGTATVIKNGFVNLTFNTTVDNNQLPLVRYEIDWGDGENTVVAGAEMNHRPEATNPHSVFHLYSYGDLKSNEGKYGITCGTDAGVNYCSIKPKVKIKDNWGWCNGGVACSAWESFGGSDNAKRITVKER